MLYFKKLNLNKLFQRFLHSKNEKRKMSKLNKKKSDKASLQILSNGYMNTPKSCMLILESNRYLINCGEGTLRLILHNNLKPSKLDNLLLTRFTWDCTGGLNGISKELEDLEHLVTLHSTKNLNLNSQNSIKKYFFEKKFKINQHNYSNGCDYKDENVLINKIDMGDSICSYLFTILKPEPNLLVDRLKKYELKPGPWMRDLKNGLDFKTPSGEVIKASDVLDFSNCIERKILFLDCSKKESIEFLKENNLINQEDMVVIVHLGDSEILNSQEYLDWVKNYINKECIHLYLDENYSNIDLIKVYEMQARLNLIDKEMFKLLPVQLSSFQKQIEQDKLKEKELQKEAKIIQAQSNMCLQLKPRVVLDLSNLNRIDNRSAQEEILNFYENDLKSKIDGIDREEQNVLDKFREKIENFNEKNEMENLIYPNVVFLGTASALPASTRNISSILVQPNESTNIILDCGECTSSQLNKYFGNDRFNIEMSKIKLLYISHNHLDHFNGLYGLILNRIKAFYDLNLPYEKLTVLYPKTLNNFFNGANLVFDKNFSDLVNLIPNDLFLSKNQNLNNFESLGIESIETVLVKHIYSSFGIALNLLENFKLVYSGDCRPSNDLVKIGQNCDLLIHECTFDNAFLDEAIKKAHSTMGEALDVSKRMNAKTTMLTHFSLRYGKLAHIDDVNRDNVGIAFDFMKINSQNFNRLNSILLDLKVAFKEHSNEIEKKRAKKLKL